MNFKNLISMFLAAAFGGIIAVFAYVQISGSDGDNSSDVAASSNPYHHLALYGSSNIRDVSYPDLTFAAEKAVNCVVHVKVKSMEETYGSIWDYLQGRTQQIPREGFGSGVILSADGYIVTNNHVIRRSDEIEVVLNNKRAYTATVIGTDPSTDLALLKIDETGLPFLTFGDSEATRVGEWVLAVGNPFNLMSTVTSGIVSAKGRDLGILAQQQRPRSQQSQQQLNIESFIQTDAAVNQGNSGGALVNIRGELIGINSAITTRTGDFSGNAFAIPTTIVQKVVVDLKEFGFVQRAVPGVTPQTITDSFAKEKDIKLEGVYVARLDENGGAAAAGIKQGDVITSINNVPINSVAEFNEQISKYRPNDKVDLIVIRDKKTQLFTVTLRNIEGTTQILRRDAIAGYNLGMTFEEVSQKEKQDLGVNSGVKVKEVERGSKVWTQGIRNGFIIITVNDRAVNSASDIQKIVDAVENRGRILFNCVNTRGEVSFHVISK